MADNKEILQEINEMEYEQNPSVRARIAAEFFEAVALRADEMRGLDDDRWRKAMNDVLVRWHADA